MKLAIVILGFSNSGKTSTIKAFVNKFKGKKISNLKRGWQNLFLNPDVQDLRLSIYCLPSSPTETNITLSNRIHNINPNFLILAEQKDGGNYEKTIQYLKDNQYKLVILEINNVVGEGVWERWERFDSTTEVDKLNHRADEIMGIIKNEISAKFK